MSSRRLIVAALLTLGLLATSGCVEPAEATPTPKNDSEDAKIIRRLLRDKPFPKEARDHLNSYMHKHAASMERVLWSALVLDYKGLDKSVDEISDSPKISRPKTGPQTPLNLMLPERFFELQDDLYSNAAALGRAAREKNDAAIAESFSSLSTTCMSCHSLYLRIEPSK